MPLIFGTSDVEVNIQGFYDRNLLENATPALIYGRYGQVRPLPRNSGTRINFRRYESLSVNTTPLTEGVTPTGKKPTITDIYATVKQYGDFIFFSDWVDMVGLDNTLMEFTDLLGDQMGLTSDTLDRDVMVAGTSVRYANGVSARGSIVADLAESDVKSAIRTLESGDAKKLKSMVVGGAKIGTRPVATTFRCIAHTDCRQSWEALPGFTKIEDYASHKNTSDEEIGTYRNVAVELTSQGKMWESAGGTPGTLKSTDSSSADIYASLVLAKNAYGITPLQRSSIKNIVKKADSGGAENPLNQRGSSGWKMAKTTKILNDDFMVRIEHGVVSL